MGMNHTPIDNSMTRAKAISQGGYYNTDGDWNCVLTLDEYPDKIFRGRVETLVLKDGKLFMYKKPNGTYRVPGGGFDRGVLNKDQAFIETKEEAKLIISNIRETGVKYIKFFKDKYHTTDRDINYDGSITEVYVADYKGDYEGRIRKGLSDKELTNEGEFYDLDEVKDILTDPHRQALENLLNNVVTESFINDLLLTAQHFQNTLSNLHKENIYTCLNNINMEPTNEGIVFAEYHTENTKEVDEVKRFVNYCNTSIRSSILCGVVEEPQSYKSGFLYIKDDNIQESRYYYPCFDSEEFLTEATNQMKKGKYPIFIVNTHTGTEFGNLIANYTKCKWNHSSIALDTSLKEIFSFNLKGGFVIESLDLFKNLTDETQMQIRCLFVTKDEIKVIKERLYYLWKNKDKTRYDVANMINIIFNIPKDTNGNKLSMVCSQFVTWLLSLADIKLLDKPFNLILPKDLSMLESPKLYLLYEGFCKDYDKSKIDRIFKKLKAKSELYKNN